MVYLFIALASIQSLLLLRGVFKKRFIGPKPTSELNRIYVVDLQTSPSLFCACFAFLLFGALTSLATAMLSFKTFDFSTAWLQMVVAIFVLSLGISCLNIFFLIGEINFSLALTMQNSSRWSGHTVTKWLDARLNSLDSYT